MPSVQQMSISPDGRKIAFVTPIADSRATLAVIDLDAGATPKGLLTSPNGNETLHSCDWASNTRLVCNIFISEEFDGKLLGFSRALAINADGSKLAQLSAPEASRALGVAQNGGRVIDWHVAGKTDVVLMTRSFVPQQTTGSIAAQSRSGLGVEEVNTVTLARRTVEFPRSDADDYTSDGHGAVRLMGTSESANSGYLTGRSKTYFRARDSRDWKPLSTVVSVDNTVTGFIPAAIDAERDVVYGFDNDKDGFRYLATMALDGTGKRETVLAKPGYDVDDLITFGRSDRIVGASYATERRNVEFFDPKLRALREALGKALPGSPQISFVDASADENQIVLVASSDTQPGEYYLYDRTTHKLGEILPYRAELAGMPLAEMKPVSFPAADGTLIPGYLTLPPGSSGKGLPALVLPHGGPSARDEWGFDWLVQYFAARGFAVLQPNYRGSSGYGSNWYQHNGFKSWRTAIGDVNDAGRWLLKQGIAAPGKLAIVGWSYGGYAALQAQVLDPDLFKAVVAVAPVTDFDQAKEEARGFANFHITEQAIGSGPHIEEGSPARHAAAFKAPVLLFHGDRDRNVGVGESRLMKNRLEAAGKAVTYVEFRGLDHQLANTAARTRLLSESDAFLRKALGL
ncbi:MAG: S9 family peptidase [Sphingomonadales bacterium]|nr:S9 family peptidase [Sphingomonadales bacterium]